MNREDFGYLNLDDKKVDVIIYAIKEVVKEFENKEDYTANDVLDYVLKVSKANRIFKYRMSVMFKSFAILGLDTDDLKPKK